MPDHDESTSVDKHLSWLTKAEHWGEWVRFSETEPAAPESIWMMRGGNGRVRFYAIGEGQVGPEHRSVVAAATWAWANRWFWTDPESGEVDILVEISCREWVLAGGAAADLDNARISKIEASVTARSNGVPE